MALNGMEIMFKSMGLAPVLDAVKVLVERRALERILAYADKADQMQSTLERIERLLQNDRSTALPCSDCPLRERHDGKLIGLLEPNGSDL